MTDDVAIRVSAIRSQNPRGLGGCIFTGRMIDNAGNVVNASSYYVVKVANKLLGPARVQVGQWWRVSGESSRHDRDINGYRVTEWQIVAQDLSLLQLSGEHIINFMADSEEFQGIGLVKARKLWDTFGESLYGFLDRGDVTTIAEVLGDDRAKQVVAAWAINGDTRTFQWLQRNGFEVAVGRKVVSYFGMEARDKLEEDPYRLLSFCATWAQVDKLARDHFAVEAADPRRLQGAVEEALYRVFGDGHTRIPISGLASRLESVLDGPCKELARNALANGLSNGSFIIGAAGNVHPLGAWIMEATVARAMLARLAVESNSPLLHPTHVDAVVAAYEAGEGITLNVEQRLAIHTSAANALSLIVGGAGVGKTTVLKALYKVYDETRTRIFQVALAGRAAKRMLEATGRPASTIASFLKTAKEEDLAGRCVLVVDEASMVDIITMSRLCEMLPAHVRIVLAGDTGQLMPVGPGLVLHALARVPGIPKVELKVVKRYGGEIALAAQAVRDGVWPELAADATGPISFVPCAASAIAVLVVELYADDVENTQILSARKNSLDGTKAINALCQNRFTRHGRPLLVYLDEFQSMAHTGFYLGDQILCTRNLWDWGLQNGSLGRLIEIEETPRLLTNSEGVELGHAIGWVLWDDGERRPVLESMLDDLELGNAVTVHKAQGSQWRRVIVVLTGSRMLDRTLIYTAMTRAQSQVILVGDPVAARRAVEGLPRANTRMVGLDSLLLEYLAQSGSPPEVPLPVMLA
jgi:exodeoxyribonuclease V alpha subunit